MKKSIWLSQILDKLFLYALMLGASTVRWSSRFHLLITLFEKMPSDIPGAPSFPKFQAVTSRTFRVFIQHKQLINSNTRWSVKLFNNSVTSCLYLLSSRVHNAKDLNLSAYDLPSISFITFVDLWWIKLFKSMPCRIFSINSVSLLLGDVCFGCCTL